MRVIESVAEMVGLRRELQAPVGFVPTMGYLHEGHITLVKKTREENATAVASIFVNPTQFGPREDLAHYPRDIPRDLKMLETIRTDIVFVPGSSEKMYPAGYNSWVEVSGITERLEGAVRPGHFRGVATVVAKLFNIVQPDRAYFGQKDAQQLLVIEKMVRDLNINVTVVRVPTVREPDGLAMSSRNVYLNLEERRQATVLYQSLKLAEQLYRDGEKDADRIKCQMTDLIEQQPLAKIDYISIADSTTLEELATVKIPVLVSLAVRFGNTRLIDNIILE
ncbi:MAG: pantoate--beta-alanine ligase [Dehalococcoidia bacterium]|jgi:pantoate--beta-alanine ligase|nr:MAG: pantoate--beta-alanine ligase [Dehalococcoidia bacterium]